MKNLFIILLIFVFQFSLGLSIGAQTAFAMSEPVDIDMAQSDEYSEQVKLNIYQFENDSCPHCRDGKIFLNKLEEKYSFLKVNYLDAYDRDARLLKYVASEFGVEVSGVPFLVIGEEYVFGFSNEIISGPQIESKITTCLDNGCGDLVQKVIDKYSILDDVPEAKGEKNGKKEEKEEK